MGILLPMDLIRALNIAEQMEHRFRYQKDLISDPHAATFILVGDIG